MSAFKRLYHQSRHPPASTTESFAGKTVLITGTSSGLGFEAAKKLTLLNASKLIITARTVDKGETTKRQIEAYIQQQAKATNAKTVTTTEIIVMPLDMSSIAGVRSFKTQLTSLLGKNGSLDAAILNAGTNQRTYVASPDGFEETLQVNLISTALLGLLVLPYLLATFSSKSKPSHLTFVSSGLANSVKTNSMQQFLSSATPIADFSQRSNFPSGTFGGQAQYARSKLLLEYAMRHIAALPTVHDPSTRTPRVIVNSTCPGMCKSDLGRQYTGSFWWKIAVWILYTFIARTADQGANSYVSAVLRGQETQGQMWKDDRVYDAGEMLTSREGLEFGEKAWEELLGILVRAAPEVKELL